VQKECEFVCDDIREEELVAKRCEEIERVRESEQASERETKR
jgi:hypothetical protein